MPQSNSNVMLALLLLAPLAFGRLRRAISIRTLPWLAALALLAVLPALSGCGNKTPANSTTSFSTPVGTTAVTVILTDSNDLSRSAVFNVTVNTP